jgi:nucleoside-diphosphate-sugar epimerase
MSNTYLVTGAMGCLGAWALYHLVRQGKHAVSFDLSDDRHRLDLLLNEDEQKVITFVRGDLTDFEQVRSAIRDHQITHIIHLAALQVPMCRANPVLGAQVNVTGTVNIFEAARQSDIRHITQASSIAVYGPPQDYPPGLIAHDALPNPTTLYGVYKVADEGIARIYWQDHKISSTGLRPYTVYGVGRDQGLTSDPTKAMLAAVKGEDFHINFAGNMAFHFASDVALQFIEAAEKPLNGAYNFNLGTQPVPVRDVAQMIMDIKPKSKITCADTILPFPEGFDATELHRHFERVYETPLADGVRQTMEHFERVAGRM